MSLDSHIDALIVREVISACIGRDWSGGVPMKIAVPAAVMAALVENPWTDDTCWGDDAPLVTVYGRAHPDARRTRAIGSADVPVLLLTAEMLAWMRERAQRQGLSRFKNIPIVVGDDDDTMTVTLAPLASLLPLEPPP